MTSVSCCLRDVASSSASSSPSACGSSYKVKNTARRVNPFPVGSSFLVLFFGLSVMASTSGGAFGARARSRTVAKFFGRTGCTILLHRCLVHCSSSVRLSCVCVCVCVGCDSVGVHVVVVVWVCDRVYVCACV